MPASNIECLHQALNANIECLHRTSNAIIKRRMYLLNIECIYQALSASVEHWMLASCQTSNSLHRTSNVYIEHRNQPSNVEIMDIDKTWCHSMDKIMWLIYLASIPSGNRIPGSRFYCDFWMPLQTLFASTSSYSSVVQSTRLLL